jgi:predicted dehydrogenase
VAEQLQVGLVGCGAWGRHILRDLLALGCAVHVCNRSPAKVPSEATSVVSDLDDLREVDGIVVAVPTSAHAEVVWAVLDRGVPIYVEKPITPDAAEARSLAEAGEGRLFVMDKWRYHPGVEELGRIAKSGELGPPVGVRAIRVGWGNPHPDVDAVWTLVPHDLAIGLQVLGTLPEPVAVAEERIDGVPWGMTALLGDDPWLAIECSGAVHDRRREVRLVCSEGLAWLPDPEASALGVSAAGAIGGEPEWRPISTELPLLRELRAFVEHLRGGPPPRSSAAEGALIVERVEALRAHAPA